MTQNDDTDPDDGTRPPVTRRALQKQADELAASLLAVMIPDNLPPQHRLFYFSLVALNYAVVVNAYRKQRDGKKLARVGPHAIQGVRSDPNDLNPSTDDQIIERMNGPYYGYASGISDVRYAYFDYVLEKEIAAVIDEWKTAKNLADKAENGLLPGKIKDEAVEHEIKYRVYHEQLEELSLGVALAVNAGDGSAGLTDPRDLRLADMAVKMVAFCESCVSLSFKGSSGGSSGGPADDETILDMLTRKALMAHRGGLRPCPDRYPN